MSELKRSGQSGALDVAANVGDFTGQIGKLVDLFRQVAGNARLVSGSGGSADPLNGPFHLYVNPYTGSDRFVGGQYNTHEAGATDEEIIAQKLRRISMQQLECGYSKQRPFRTINRACIEAAIITSRNWYTYNDERAHVDCVVIELSTGRHIVYNDPGSATANLASWGNAKDPTIADLIAFNPPTGGVLLPRGASTLGKVLRKTVLRPNWVPAFADEAADYSNRRQMLLVTGSYDGFQFTVMDKLGQSESCHLFSALGAASQAELNLFYDKVESTVGTGADLASALLAARPTEYQTPGPIDQTQAPTPAWNSTAGASPYPFQVSVRSSWGMGSVFWDGAKMAGLKSMVRANFTNTNQQGDLRCFQVYENGAWVTLTNDNTGQAKYYAATPDNIRRHPGRHSYGLLAVRDAYLQDVSIFGIGLSRRTKVDSGADITDNNGNTTFGELSAEAAGYKSFAFPVDRNWAISRIQVPLNLSEKLSNVRRIELGVVASVTSSTITLSNGLAIDASSTTVPAVLLGQNYSLANGTRIWVENPQGNDWRATLTSSAWSSSAPTVINITGALQESGTNAAAGSAAVGRRVYIRRVVDTRTIAERRASLILSNTASARLPQRDQVLQTDPARSGGQISRVLAGGGEEVLIVTAAGTGPAPGAGVVKTSELTIRRGAPNRTYAASTFYRRGMVVRHAGKHWQATKDLVSVGAAPDPALWLETLVQMPSDFNPEESASNETPLLILDTDTSDSDSSTTLGINWSTIWTSAGPVRDQYRTGTDYLGIYGFLRALGFTDSQAHAALVPKVAASRQLDPSSAVDFPDAPAGGAASGRGNWAVEFRRPSTLRFYNHNWEWAGWGNYDRSLPSVQGDLSPANKFSAYFISNAGGRVVPKGSNEDGFEVTPKGLEDIATGATISPEGLGGQTLDEIQRTDFPNGIQVGGTASLQDVVINGQVEYGNQALAKTTRPGVGQLASIERLALAGVNAPAASTNVQLESNPELVTLLGINYWAIQQRFLRASTDTVVVYVSGSAADRNLDSMLSTPPTSSANAIPTLARASEYVNAVIGSGNQTAEIRIAPGLYSPASVWQCNVRLVACNADFTNRWPGTSNGTGFIASSDAVANNHFDGSGYGDLANSVNFYSQLLTLRDSIGAGGNLQLLVNNRTMIFERGFNFQGGLHFLGLADLIKLVADNVLSRTLVVTDSATTLAGHFTSSLSTNIDTLLAGIRVLNSRGPSFDTTVNSPVISARGSDIDLSVVKDCVFGPLLPSRKDALGTLGSPYVEIRGLTEVRYRNIYLRGNSIITRAGINAGGGTAITSGVTFAGNAHYGTAATSGDWTWKQFCHTFIGINPTNPKRFSLVFGGSTGYQSISDSSISTTYYQDGTGKLLPNHIHLLDNTGALATNTTDGPFLDQLIHAPAGLTGGQSWRRAGESNTGIEPTLRYQQGFLGKFGSNGYNSTLTRGVLGGNDGDRLPETGFTFTLTRVAIQDSPGINGRSIFVRAGLTSSEIGDLARVSYIAASPEQAPGTANPSGNNPVITADNSGNAALNMGLRSYRLGIDSATAATIPSSNVIL